MPTSDPRIDHYIASAAPFARPILRQFRKLVHKSTPEIEETTKWRMPFFTYGGTPICHIAAFKAHCGIGFWHREVQAMIAAEVGVRDTAMGQFGRITAPADLPSQKLLLRLVSSAVHLVKTSQPQRPSREPSRRPPKTPADLARRLQRDAKARATFAGLSPSHRREYIEWIVEAKRAETRTHRLDTTIAWLRAGKTRNWKYTRR
jgi:uncharacterized protein YdeI (YjbR/CyaY-like superfamily)